MNIQLRHISFALLRAFGLALQILWLVVSAPLRVLAAMASRWWAPNSLLSRVTGHALLEVLSTRQLYRHSPLPTRVRICFARTGVARLATTIIVYRRSGTPQRIATSPFSGPVYVDRNVSLAEAAPLIPKGRDIIYAGRDRTFPNQTDARYAMESKEENIRLVNTLLLNGAKRVLVENLDITGFGASPLPSGVLPNVLTGSVRLVRMNPDGRILRRQKVLSASRIRIGEQWETRRKVTRLAKSEWREFCDHLEMEVSLRKFRQLLASYSFVLCPEGGGLDPSPKAFEALLAGCIPVVRRNSASEGYSHLPVLFVDAWVPTELTWSRLQEAESKLRCQLDDRINLLLALQVKHYV